MKANTRTVAHPVTVLLAAALNFLVASHRMVLGFYSLPTLFAAYVYGRRHAVLTAFASIFIVGLVLYNSPAILDTPPCGFLDQREMV